MLEPWLSVVMPTYNGERYVAAALESVRRESGGDVEVIVVDDGSTDGTLDVVRRYERTMPLEIITNGRLGNWAATSNVGLRRARAEWASFLHQDDVWLPGRLEAVRRATRSAAGALVLHHAVYIGPDGKELGSWRCPLRAGDVPSHSFVERLLVQNFIAMPSPTFRRSAALREGGLDEKIWFTPDWDLWLRLGAEGPVRFIGEELAGFRLHPESQTIARPIGPGEWREQLSVVLDRHLARWTETSPRLRSQVERVAGASVEVNAILAAASRKQEVRWLPLFTRLLRLGPSGWWRYLRDSRIVERVRPRLGLRARA